MIDWGRISPSNPTPAAPAEPAPSTTAPVAPAQPGSLPGSMNIPIGTAAGPSGAPGGGQYGTGREDAFHGMTKEEVDKLDPLQKLGRGWDAASQFLFGEKSALHDTFIPDIFGAVGGVVGGVADWTVVKPFNLATDIAGHMPLGGAGADAAFKDLGAWAEKNDPIMFHEWQKVNAASGDPLTGGNIRADWNTEALKYLDDQQYDSFLGTSPTARIGMAGHGSVGQLIGHTIEGWLGLGSGAAQEFFGGSGLAAYDATRWGATIPFEQLRVDVKSDNKETQGAISDEVKEVMKRFETGSFTEGQAKDWLSTLGVSHSRVEAMDLRQQLGLEVSEVEAKAISAWKGGAWSKEHANEWIITHGQGISKDPLAQVVGSVLSDPLTYAAIGAGAVSGLGKAGLEAAEAGFAATTRYEQLAGFINNSVRSVKVVSETGQVTWEANASGKVFRLMRGLVDPFAVYKPSATMRAITDLRNGLGLEAFRRAHNPFAVRDLRAIGREFGKDDEMSVAIGSYIMDSSNRMVAREAESNLLEAHIDELMEGTNVDELIAPMVSRAGRDAVTELTDDMSRTAKNTFTAEEEANLAARLSITLGNDIPYWTKRLASTSMDTKQALHVVVYKMPEKELVEALAKVDREAYKGTAPIGRMVFISDDHLDDVVATQIIAKIRGILKAKVGKPIDEATAEWNAMARRYPKMDEIGHAPGGKNQVKAYVDDLEKQVQDGKITRRLTEDELADPALGEVRNVVDKYSVPLGEAPSVQKWTPRAPVEPPDSVYGHTVANGGGTFDAVTGRELGLKSGYGVANEKAGGGIVVANEKAAVEEAYAKVSESGAPNIGTWLNPDTGMIHVDPTEVIESLDEALRVAGARGELAIYDFAKGADIPVPATGPAVKRLWNIGFRADEEVAFGWKRSPITGQHVIDRDPTITHVVDAVPMHQWSDTTRDLLGRVVGKSHAERLNRPLDGLEAMIGTMTDGITGSRLVHNIDRRFERSTFDIGIPKSISKPIMQAAKDAAGWERTTIRGLRPSGNLMEEVHKLIPDNLVLKDGSTLDIHVVMDHLLQAAEGDLRIMGTTSHMTQRMRSILVRLNIDPDNWVGYTTVTLYNKLRYSQPTFLVQRVTDSIYYSLIYGFLPVGGGAIKGETNQLLQRITENIGKSSMARYFSFDMPEFATVTNFTAGIKTVLQQKGLLSSGQARVAGAADALIANNMTNMMSHRLGNLMQGVLDNLAEAAEKGEPALRADLLEAGQVLQRSMGEWRRIYSESAGRVLTNDEVGVRWYRDVMNGWRRVVKNPDGTLDYSGLIAEGERSVPNNISIEPLRPDTIARELNFPDGASLREAVMGHMEKDATGKFVLVPGSHDIAWLEEQFRETLSLHPDATRRGLNYFGDTWGNFWNRLSKGVDEGGLDISQHYAKEAQDLIGKLAQERDMDPWEYVTGVIASNIGGKDLATEMGQLATFLKAGAAKQPLEEWVARFRATLDPSAQDTLLANFRATAEGANLPAGVIDPARFEWVVPKSAPGKAARPPVAKAPGVFKAEPGYVYRVENPEVVAMGWPTKHGVSTGTPTAFYEGKDGVAQGIFRTKGTDGDLLSTGRHGAGGTDRLTTRPVPPEDIEMLAADGTWHPLSASPYDSLFEVDFPAAIRQRVLSGAPHPNPEVESYMQALSKYVQTTLGPELGDRTRAEIRRIVQAIPTAQASSFNRAHALVLQLVKQKMREAERDIFRLAEMQTKRTFLERSLNHPLWALYPSSYMWGKVLPESIKFFAKNPYAATYIIADVQRAIAVQREYSRDMEDKISKIDRSAVAMLLDFITPGLPWNEHAARLSPAMRDIIKGAPEDIFRDELRTVSPERWISLFTETVAETPELIGDLLDKGNAADTGTLPGLQQIVGGAGGATPATVGTSPTGAPQITGSVSASALGPILLDDLARLSSILLEGASPEE